MSFRLLALVAFTAALGCADSSRAAPSPTSRQATTAPTTRPVAAVWYEQSGMRILAPGEKFEPHRLIVGVWGDGTVVWSDDRATGGAPYRTARVEPAVVAGLARS